MLLTSVSNVASHVMCDSAQCLSCSSFCRGKCAICVYCCVVRTVFGCLGLLRGSLSSDIYILGANILGRKMRSVAYKTKLRAVHCGEA